MCSVALVISKMKKIKPENDANIHSLEWIKWKHTIQQYCVQEERYLCTGVVPPLCCRHSADNSEYLDTEKGTEKGETSVKWRVNSYIG